jgi:hypothetical protein
MSDPTQISGEPPGESPGLPRPDEPAGSPPAADEDLIIVGAGIDFTDPNSPLAPFYLRTTHVVLAAFLGLFFAIFSHFPVWHTDVWAHLRFGKEIVDDIANQHRLPGHEPFAESFVDKSVQYIHYQWVSQAGAYLVYQAGAVLSPPDADHRLGGGALLLVMVHALILVLRFVLLYLAFQRLSGSPPVALLGVVLVCVMGLFVHVPILRPQALGELAFAAVLLPLSRPVLSRRALILVPLVFLVWANCHATFVMGFILLGAVAVGRAIEVVMSPPGEPSALLSPARAIRALLADTQLRRLSLVIVLSVLATLVNPHGPYLLINSYAVSQNANITTMEEWKPLPLHSAVHLVFFGSVVLLAVLLRLSPRRFTPAQLLLLLGFGLQSVAHARMVVWWIMVFAWVAVPHIRAVAGRFPGRMPWLDDSGVRSLTKTFLAVAFVAAFALWSRPAWWLIWEDAPTSQGRVTTVTPIHVLEQIRTVDAARDLGAWLSASTPLEAAALSCKDLADADRARAAAAPPSWPAMVPLDAAALTPAGPRPHVIFASETSADYLLWQLGQGEPQPMRLCCYTHVHLFTKEQWDRCMQVKLANHGWQEALDRMGADVLVLENDLYEQEGRKKQGKSPGFSNLIDRIREAPDRWQVISEPDAPLFIAQRMR